MRLNLDRYVGRAMLGSFGASLAFFLFLTIVLDVLHQLDDYLDGAEERGRGTFGLLGDLAGYYLLQIPVQFVLIAPFATVIGCMFAVARLMAQNELQPMLFVGRSMGRILRPALLCGLASALGMVACWQWAVPRVATAVTEARSTLTGGDRKIEDVVLELRGERFEGLRVSRYDPRERRLEGVGLLREGSAPGDAALVQAAAATWDEQVGDWRLEGGWRRTGAGEQPCQFLGAPELLPERILEQGLQEIDCDLLSYGELWQLREQRPHRKDVVMALHRHITFPLANLILLLLALPFAISFERGSRIERVLGAIGVCAAYLLFDLTCQSLGLNGFLHPVVMAWSPTILFGSLGVVMYGGIRT